MGKTVSEKILSNHTIEKYGSSIAIKIDQTLTQDATGTMAYLQFETLNIPKVKTELSVSYIDHNTLQTGFENADDHKFLQSVADKYNILLSRAGNGICHQVHLERFAAPGKTLLGSDSHTPTAGGIGCLAMGAGGLDIAVAMAGSPFHLTMPKIVGVKLTGKLKPWVSAKDIILEILRLLDVKGGVGKILEYFGEGVKTLSVPERATITNMGTEVGATTSVFPSDEITKQFLESQDRADDWQEIIADEDARYEEIIEINLSELEPMIAHPHSPGKVTKVKEIENLKVDQICIGSCTNSSYKDLMIAAKALKGKKIHPEVSLTISPGSKQVYTAMAKNGALADLIEAGARILECTCGPCIGMGQSPNTNAVSLRTFNRNFEGRSGTKSAQVYLVSPETAVAAALTGKITDPTTLDNYPEVQLPTQFEIDDSMILKPTGTAEVLRGPNIKPLPINNKLPAALTKEVLLKVDDNITTDHIMPAGSKILPLRSNIPKISEHVFENVDSEFVSRAKEKQGGIIIAGENYGQGSSREHAALAPMYLGIKAVIAKSFARIHKANLINFGILPLEFVNPEDYNKVSLGDVIEFENLDLKENTIQVTNKTKNIKINVKHDMTKRSVSIIQAGGLLNHIKTEVNQMELNDLTAPTEGSKIEIIDGKLKVPNNPIICLIKGDGIGPDVSSAGVKVIEAAVEKAYNGEKKISWLTLPAGESAIESGKQPLPEDTFNAIKEYKVAIKGPLTTPVGGGYRSLNVTLRQKLDLYACVRPVRYFTGVPNPMKAPEKLDVVIFRENTEDVYAGIEWKQGTDEAKMVIDFLSGMGKTIREDSGIGIKPISITGTKRLVKAAINYAIQNNKKSITLVHKGNIMKFTEGAFMEWGYEVAKEFPELIPESELQGDIPHGKIVIKDRIADAMFQQLLLRPDEYDVLAMPNLNGDYISDACAAQVGGLGLAPGANINYDTGIALFEATHGTAPKYKGMDKVNPGSFILSGVMMLEHLGWKQAADLIIKGIEKSIDQKTVTYDLHRQMQGATLLKCSEFGNAIIKNME